VKHISGTKNGGADALSRRGTAEEDSEEEDDEMDDFFEARMYGLAVSRVDSNPVARVWLHEREYDGDDLVLGRCLETLERPEGMDDQRYEQLRKKSRNFFVRDGYLFKRSRKRGLPPRRVIGPAQRMEVIRELHDEKGHRGRQSTFEHVNRRYQWKGMYDDVVKYVQSCEECQRRARIRYEEPLHLTWSIIVWEKLGVDIVTMPLSKCGKKYIVFARDDFSGWIEGEALEKANSQSVAKFLYEDVICRHGYPRRIVMDGGPENKLEAADLLDRYRIKKVIISAYHPQSNGLVERGHDDIVNSLSKYCSKKQEEWDEYLPLVLWADRISVCRTTGYSAFELVYGRDF
jgi:Integrase zinc binding domain/Integrase core domain